MQRKDFLRTCGMACLSGTLVTSLLSSCTGTKLAGGMASAVGKSGGITGTITGDNLVVPASSFPPMVAGEKTKGSSYVIIHNNTLKYPICLYRHADASYSALYMRCTHQGAEVEVFGDKLVCPAHGSEFSAYGALQNGPAEQGLRTFPVSQSGDNLLISLKAV